MYFFIALISCLALDLAETITTFTAHKHIELSECNDKREMIKNKFSCSLPLAWCRARGRERKTGAKNVCTAHSTSYTTIVTVKMNSGTGYISHYWHDWYTLQFKRSLVLIIYLNINSIGMNVVR